MNLNLSAIFPAVKKPPVKIRFTSNISIRVNGKSISVCDGDEMEIPYSDCQQLDPSDYQVTSSISPTAAVQVADPTPAREEPAPLPDRWNELPQCFQDWHRMTQDLIVARKHINAIRETRRNVFGTDADFSDVEGTFLAGGVGGGDNRTNYFSTLQPFNMSDPTTKRLARFLAAGLAGAEDYLARLREKTTIPLQRAFYESGMHHLTKAEEVQILVAEIKGIGYQIFEHRLSALGLAEGHLRRLYSGSADFLKYGNLAEAHFAGRCSAGYDEAGILRVYSDEPVPATACHSLRDMARIPELQALLKQAKAELHAAQKVGSRAA